MGLIEEQAAEGTRKKFAITDAGRAHLDENAEEVAALMTRLAQVGEMRERTDGAPIRRAMGHLRQVRQNRLTRDEVGAEPVLDAAAFIDADPQKNERRKRATPSPACRPQRTTPTPPPP